MIQVCTILPPVATTTTTQKRSCPFSALDETREETKKSSSEACNLPLLYNYYLSYTTARISVWMRSMLARYPNHLPATRLSLAKAIERHCLVVVDVDPEVVLFQLVIDGFLRLDPTQCVWIRQEAAQAVLPDHPPGSTMALACWRAAQWCQKALRPWTGVPKAALLASLAQVCRVRHQIAPAEAIAALQKEGKIEIDQSGRVHYPVNALLAASNSNCEPMVEG